MADPLHDWGIHFVKRRWLKFLSFGLLALLAILLLAGFLVLRTETGAGWALAVAQEQVHGLEIDSYRGSLHDGLELQELAYDSQTFSLDADKLSLVLGTEWFPFVLRVETIEVEKLEYRIKTVAAGSGPFELPESLLPPFKMDFPSIRLNGISVLDESGDPLFRANLLAARVSLDNEFRVHDLKLNAEQGRVAAAGRVQLERPFKTDLGLEADLAFPVDGEEDPLSLVLAVDLNGPLDTLEATSRGTIDPPRFRPHSYSAASIITFSGMETKQFALEGPSLWAKGAGSLDWNAQAARLEKLRVEIPGTDFVADMDLALDLKSERIEGDVAWSGLDWPLIEQPARWSSPEGRVKLSGDLDEWAMQGEAQLAAPGYPQGWVRFDTNGDRGGLEARIHDATVLNGRLHGSGAYRWDDGGTFSADFSLENLATSQLLPDYPAVLSGALAASGRIAPLQFELGLHGLHGEFLDKQFLANGEATLSDGRLSAEAMNVEFGTSRLFLDGYPDGVDGLTFNAFIADLGDLLPGGRGVLDANGLLFLNDRQPSLRVEARGSDLAWKDIEVSSLDLSDSGEHHHGPDAFDVSLAEVRLGGLLLDEITANIALDAERQGLVVNARSGARQLVAEVGGGFTNRLANRDRWSWSGLLRRFELALGENETIRLDRPASLRFAEDEAQLETSCLVASGGVSACLEATWSSLQGSEFSARIEHWPLDNLSEALGLQIRIGQYADGTVNLAIPPAGAPSGSGEFRISAGVLAHADDQEPILETGEGALSFTLSEGRLASGRIDIPLPGQGVIDVDYEIPDLTRGLDAKIHSSVIIEFWDLSWLTGLLPMVDQVAGSLKADLDVGGTLAQPRITGLLNLENGTLANRANGLTLEDIALSGSLVGNREARLTGAFRAEEGIGRLEARVDLRNIRDPGLEISVSGEQLKLFDARDLMVVIDPDFSLALQGGAVTVDGELHVPSALLAPAVIPRQAFGESPDLLVIAGQPEEEPEDPRENQPLSVLGGLRVTLGDAVRVDLAMAELGVTGTVDFDWRGEQIPVANGSFNLDGEILAFGQLLKITRGNIGFQGVPADNPRLNIRAEREIYGNSDVRRAGLLVAGTIRRPVVEPYTNPMTNRDRAQTLLVTGSDFNMERGVGSVNVGTYIAPRIFVSYGHGVFDEQGVLSIRYDLGRGWGVKASSGERQSGVDISFTVDR
jgi:translocation and assembly module TamB